MKKREKSIILITLILIILVIAVVITGFYFNNNKINTDTCNINPKKPHISETDAEYDLIKSKCDQLTDCSWNLLGGKITSIYACCPKNISEESKNNLPISIQERCLITID